MKWRKTMSKIRQIPKSAIAGIIAGLVALAVVFWPGATDPEVSVERHKLALMTSLPIFWPEGGDIASLLDGTGETPWVRESLEQRYEMFPLDTLSASSEGEAGPLNEFDRLLLAQPRGLSASDNAALDAWVRDGGRLLYLLDPMLTGHYAVPVGDPSHPTLVGLIPPVIQRWGLTMQYRDRQPFELREVSYGEGVLPVQLAGDLLLMENTEGLSEEQLAARGDCTLLGDGIAASCKIGKGQVFVLADAALLEMHESEGDAEAQLLALIDHTLESAN